MKCQALQYSVLRRTFINCVNAKPDPTRVIDWNTYGAALVEQKERRAEEIQAVRQEG